MPWPLRAAEILRHAIMCSDEAMTNFTLHRIVPVL